MCFCRRKANHEHRLTNDQAKKIFDFDYRVDRHCSTHKIALRDVMFCVEEVKEVLSDETIAKLDGPLQQHALKYAIDLIISARILIHCPFLELRNIAMKISSMEDLDTRPNELLRAKICC